MSRFTMTKRLLILLVIAIVFGVLTVYYSLIPDAESIDTFYKKGTSDHQRLKHHLRHLDHDDKNKVHEKIHPASQVGQDVTVFQILGKHNGFFIEMGAFDGKTLSNTFWLERKHNWTGLLIEANPDFCRTILNTKRNVWLLCSCISSSKQENIYIKNGPCGGNKDSLFHTFLKKANKKNTVHVPCFDLTVVLNAIGRKEIDYFSLDVEGAELNVLESIKQSLISNDINVSVWTIEFRIYDGKKKIDAKSKIKLQKIRDFFASLGNYFEYSILPKLQHDEEGLDVVFVSKQFWCKKNLETPQGKPCQ